MADRGRLSEMWTRKTLPFWAQSGPQRTFPKKVPFLAELLRNPHVNGLRTGSRPTCRRGGREDRNERSQVSQITAYANRSIPGKNQFRPESRDSSQNRPAIAGDVR